MKLSILTVFFHRDKLESCHSCKPIPHSQSSLLVSSITGFSPRSVLLKFVCIGYVSQKLSRRRAVVSTPGDISIQRKAKAASVCATETGRRTLSIQPGLRTESSHPDTAGLAHVPSFSSVPLATTRISPGATKSESGSPPMPAVLLGTRGMT